MGTRIEFTDIVVNPLLAAEVLERFAGPLVADMAGDVADVARELTPVDTGALRDSIGVQVRAGEADVVANIDYAAFVELGTEDTPPQPFLRQALGAARRTRR